MEKKFTVLTWMLALSLVLNFFAVWSINNLAGRFQDYTYSYFRGDFRMLEHRLDYLSGAVSDLHEKSRWVINQEFTPDPENSSPKEIHMYARWSFRELEQGASIYILYREGGEDEWLQVQAEKIPDSVSDYRAPLVLAPDKEYRYRIVAEGGTTRIEDIAHIPVHLYQRPELRMSGWGGSVTDDDVHYGLLDAHFSQEPGIPLFDFYQIVQVLAKIIYMDGQEQAVELSNAYLTDYDHLEDYEDEELYEQWRQEGLWRLEVEGIEKVASIVLEVRYADGEVSYLPFWPEAVHGW